MKTTKKKKINININGPLEDSLWLMKDEDGSCYYILYGKKPQFNDDGEYDFTHEQYCLESPSAKYFELRVNKRHHLKPGEIRRLRV